MTDPAATAVELADAAVAGDRRALARLLTAVENRTPIAEGAMRRHIGPGDASVLAHVMRRVKQTGADVVHGHGAKGGAYARMALNASRAVRAYTPHGGSLLFGHDSVAGKFYLATEKLLMLRGDLFLFESAYSAEVFRRKIGKPHGLIRVVHNGVSQKEFEPITTQAEAADLVFMGEFRPVKGVDVLIDAIAQLHRGGRVVTATLVGDGPEREAIHIQAQRAGACVGDSSSNRVSRIVAGIERRRPKVSSLGRGGEEGEEEVAHKCSLWLVKNSIA
jgi:glycosyltransferase involved in cell wall biosynthesis